MGIPIALYLLALVVRGVLIAAYPDAAYPDSFYYADVARALHAGHGLSVDFIWIFPEVGGRIPAIPTLPIPSNAHWMPLASLVQVPFLFAFGDHGWAGALPFALIGSLAAPLTWALAREAGARPMVAVGAGVLTAIPALMTVFMPQPDNFSLYQPLVIGALWMTGRGLKGSSRSFAVAGLLVGLATLARNDGILVGFVVALAFAWDRWRAWRSRRALRAFERATERAAAEREADLRTSQRLRAQAALGAAERAAGRESGGLATTVPTDGSGPADSAAAGASREGPHVVIRVGVPSAQGPIAAPEIREPRIPWASAFACLGLFLLVMAPWWVRQMLVFGSLSPSTASGRVLFIQTIEEWNSITGEANLAHLLAMGLPALAWSRLLGFVAAVVIFTVLVGAVFLVPFMAVGAGARRRSVDFGPFLAFAVVLFLFSGLVSAVHVPGGTFIHSAVALAPYSYVLALEGVLVAVDWIGARRRWNVAQAGRVFVTATVGLGVLLGLAYVPGVHATWDAARQERLAIAAALDRLGVPKTDRIMSIDASGTRYFTGRGGVVLVNDPIETIRDVAAAYDIHWLILENGDTVPAMAPVLRGESRPDWIGEPVFMIPAGPGSRAAWAVAVYPVCTATGDMRCGPIRSSQAP